MNQTADLSAFADESISHRSTSTQEYLIGAAILSTSDQEAIREELRPLRLPGQIKLHWTDESARRRRRIVDAIAAAGPMNIIVSHLSEPRRTAERFRRKCLEALYDELASAEVHSMTLESRSPAQDSKDRAHVVALQGQGLDRRIRIQHLRGGDEPLLWIPDAVLGSINSARRGDPLYLDALRETILREVRTAESLNLDGWASERP